MRKNQAHELIIKWHTALKKKIVLRHERDFAVRGKKPKHTVREWNNKHAVAVTEEMMCLKLMEDYAIDSEEHPPQ